MSTAPWHERLQRELRAAGISRRDLARALGKSAGSVNEWARGARMPAGETLLAIEDLLPGMRPARVVSPVRGVDPRDPNGYTVHLPLDPAQRARVLLDLLGKALDERDRPV